MKQLTSLKLTRLGFAGIHLSNSVIKPNVSHGHAVLRECSRLVGANGRRRAERFHGFEILDQTIPPCHPFGRQCEKNLR